jgi:precorrin-6B methylase 1
VSRLLVVDENLDKRISTELNRRGRTAKTVAELGLKGWKDPRLLERLHEIDADCVLITGDDAMPATHAAELSRLGMTVAVIAAWESTSSLVEPQWEHEIAQKWAHRMELQVAGSVVRYSLATSRKWTLRKRTPRIPH